MRLAWFHATLVALPLLQASAQKAVVHSLHDGEHLVLQGRLRPDPQGRLQFMTLSTLEGFLLPGRDGIVLHAIALAGSIDYATLYAHRSEAVTVSGTVETDEASPYFLHGTRFTVKSITTSGGQVLSGYAAATPMSATLKSYRATAILPSDLAEPWLYRVAGHPEAQRGWMSCSSNGGGDVVNCFCAEGFHPSKVTGPDHHSATLFADTRMAQFGVGDEARQAVLNITCTR